MSAAGGPRVTVDTVKKKVNTKGKEDVLCKYCDKVICKDKVGKHFDNNRKDRKEKGEMACFEYIAAGTPGLGKFGFVQKDEKKDDDHDANYDNDYLDNSEDNFDQTNVVPEVEEVGEKKRQHDDGDDDDDGERSKKKVKSSILDDFKKLLDKEMDDVMAHVDQKIESVKRQVEKLKKVDQNQNEAQQAPEKSQKTDEELKNMIFNCTDIHMLEEVLESEALGIKEVDINEEIDGYYCDICYAGTKPDFTSLGLVGAFTFNKLANTKLECWG